MPLPLIVKQAWITAIMAASIAVCFHLDGERFTLSGFSFIVFYLSLFGADLLRLPPPHQCGECQPGCGIALPAGIPGNNQFSLCACDPYKEQTQALLDVIDA